MTFDGPAEEEEELANLVERLDKASTAYGMEISAEKTKLMDPHSTAPKNNTCHKNEVLPQNTTHLIQRPCYQRVSPWKDPAGNWTTRRPPDNRKETQTAVVWSCFSFIRSGQNHLARHGERGKKTRQTEKEVGREHQGMDRPRVRQVPEGNGEQGKMEKTGCKILRGAQRTLRVKELRRRRRRPVNLSNFISFHTSSYFLPNSIAMFMSLGSYSDVHDWNTWRTSKGTCF